jgi:hypothetical protein
VPNQPFREPVSRDKLADAKMLRLIPRLPFPNFPDPLPVKNSKRRAFGLLCNKFEVLHNVEPKLLERMLQVALTIAEPQAFIQPTEVRKLERKVRKLAKEIEAAEATGFLLAAVREQYEKRLITMEPLSSEGEEIIAGPRAARVRAALQPNALRHLKGEQKRGDQIVKLLGKHADQYKAWLESVKEKAPARAKRLGRLKLLYFGLYVEHRNNRKIPYLDVTKVLECVEGFPDNIDDSKYRKDMLDFMLNCKDSWLFVLTIFRHFDPIPYGRTFTDGTAARRAESPITHPSQYEINMPEPSDPEQ